MTSKDYVKEGYRSGFFLMNAGVVLQRRFLDLAYPSVIFRIADALVYMFLHTLVVGS